MNELFIDEPAQWKTKILLQKDKKMVLSYSVFYLKVLISPPWSFGRSPLERKVPLSCPDLNSNIVIQIVTV